MSYGVLSLFTNMEVGKHVVVVQKMSHACAPSFVMHGTVGKLEERRSASFAPCFIPILSPSLSLYTSFFN